MSGHKATMTLLRGRLWHENPSWEHRLSPWGSIVSLSPAVPELVREQEAQRARRAQDTRLEAAALAEVA